MEKPFNHKYHLNILDSYCKYSGFYNNKVIFFGIKEFEQGHLSFN